MRPGTHPPLWRLSLLALAASFFAACATSGATTASGCESTADGTCTVVTAVGMTGSQSCTATATLSAGGDLSLSITTTGEGYPQFTAEIVLNGEPVDGGTYPASSLQSAALTADTSTSATWTASSGEGDDLGDMELDIETYTDSDTGPTVHGSLTAILVGTSDGTGALSICVGF